MTQDTITTLRTFNDELEASMAQDKLKANGIDSFLEDGNAIGLTPLSGVDLKIFSRDKEQAEKIIGE